MLAALALLDKVWKLSPPKSAVLDVYALISFYNLPHISFNSLKD